ncbi:uncharacterized protein BO87DRAFT_453666 [Aspergillus neoniger CBS 115656]|uniref:Uncharacterized protein n=1 Tax=Aspergillus neoniger (strain CBS 115656) TaxID=1448310 RepID=A0A318Y2Y5_ASPNB|nr:hypothetical protein BO87DRAFT_453666 [Aspergillus neoniger CBS 115656]PYH28159.1 hypothetical protein BO87DRAFT_453666 [Aspergillus neoniger CBS 115656]
MRLFGRVRPPHHSCCLATNRCSCDTVPGALRNRCTKKPTLYVGEMVAYRWVEFGVLPSASSIKRVLASAGGTRKKGLAKSKGPKSRTTGLLPFNVFEFCFCRLAFLDE